MGARLEPAPPAVSAAAEPAEVVEEPDVEESAPIGPSADEEAAFLAEQRDASPASALAATEPEEETPGDLPALDELVKRIPPEVLGVMDELFRARFVKVERVAKKALKG